MTSAELKFLEQCKQVAQEINSVNLDYIRRSELAYKRIGTLQDDPMWDTVVGIGTGELGALWGTQASKIPAAQVAAYAGADTELSLQQLKDQINP